MSGRRPLKGEQRRWDGSAWECVNPVDNAAGQTIWRHVESGCYRTIRTDDTIAMPSLGSDIFSDLFGASWLPS